MHFFWIFGSVGVESCTFSPPTGALTPRKLSPTSAFADRTDRSSFPEGGGKVYSRNPYPASTSRIREVPNSHLAQHCVPHLRTTARCPPQPNPLPAHPPDVGAGHGGVRLRGVPHDHRGLRHLHHVGVPPCPSGCDSTPPQTNSWEGDGNPADPADSKERSLKFESGFFFEFF